MVQIFFAHNSYQSRSLPVSAQKCQNMFMERQKPDEGKSQIVLFGVPGLTAFATCGAGPIRGLWTLNSTLYAVSGTSLYSVASDGTSTLLGTGISGTQPVSMADNGTELIIVNGSGGWDYDTTNGLRVISDTAFYPADTVTFFDNYFVFNRTGTNQWFISGILDGFNYDGLAFASAEASSKNLIGLSQNIQLLFLFSADHIEVWYDAGTADFPFQRYTGGVIWRGCIAPKSIIKQDDAIFFLGDDKSFYVLQGNEPRRISTHAIDHIIRQDPHPEFAHCMTYATEGHKFVHLTLPESQHTLVYDTVTAEWHERSSWDSNNVDLRRWRGNCSCDAYGQTYIGDAYDGVISKIDWDAYTERGNTIQALLHSVPLHKDRARIFLSKLEVDMETGVGLNTGQGSDPQVMLRYSRDGGRTWSAQQPPRSLGKIGEYLKRLRWLALGQARSWTFELTISDPIRRVFIAAHADAEEGM